MAGCCYGIPYDGIGAVVFPEGSYADLGHKIIPGSVGRISLLNDHCICYFIFADKEAVVLYC